MRFQPGHSAAVVLAITTLCCCARLLVPVASFAPATGIGRTAYFSQDGISGDTALWGRAIKRGKLAANVSPGGVKGTTKKKKRGGSRGGGPSSSSASSSSSTSPSSAGGISSKLSEWAASTPSDDAGDAVATATAEPTELEEAEEAVVQEVAQVAPSPPSKKGRGKKASGADRKSRQAERREQEFARKKLVERTLDDLDDIFDPVDEDGKPITQRKVEYDLPHILNQIRTLIDNPNPNGGLRVLCSGQKLRDYRMVWAGSDDAICHLGTGLHNVPLARLQEIFLTLGKGRIDVKEVIRIIGPFPNVRNTLKGDALAAKGSRLQITYDSMVDGTGKEILAGTENNKRAVDLNVLYADEGAVVCVVPPAEGKEEEEGGDADPLGENGSRVLLFFGEDDMDLKLEGLRVG